MTCMIRQKLTKLIQVRMDVEDYEKIQRLASEAALPASSWLRSQIHLWLKDTPRRVIRTYNGKEEVKGKEKNEY